MKIGGTDLAKMYIGNKLITNVAIGSSQLVLPNRPIPVSVSDFANGVYSLAGVAKTLSDLWVQDNAWASHWVPGTDIIAGQGIKYIGTGAAMDNGPVSTAAHIAAVVAANGGSLSNGLTAVYELEVEEIFGTGDVKIDFYLTDATYTNQMVCVWRPWHTQAADENFSPSSIFIRPYPSPPGVSIAGGEATVGIHRVAYTLTPTGFAYSVDGGPVVFSTQANDTTGFNRFGPYFEGGLASPGFVRLGKCEIYAPVSNEMLPIVSHA